MTYLPLQCRKLREECLRQVKKVVLEEKKMNLKWSKKILPHSYVAWSLTALFDFSRESLCLIQPNHTIAFPLPFFAPTFQLFQLHLKHNTKLKKVKWLLWLTMQSSLTTPKTWMDSTATFNRPHMRKAVGDDNINASNPTNSWPPLTHPASDKSVTVVVKGH